jgi:hypothetical protein
LTSKIHAVVDSNGLPIRLSARTSQVRTIDHIKVFSTLAAAEAWFEEKHLPDSYRRCDPRLID